jgi:segregation and condensation protein B
MPNVTDLIPHIEALVFASDKPLTSPEITDLVNSAFGFMEDKVEAEQVDAALEGIIEKYASEFYPFEVRQSGGGWQFLTKKDYHKTVAQLNGEKFLKRLSAAALETLAIIAYKQPVTKGEIESIRGVSSDYAVQKLLEKELIIITGRNEKLPGHPLVYATSKNFMDYFGINSPEDLPKIREVLADQIVQPTAVHHTEFEQSEVLAVSDEGNLIPLPVNEPEEGGVNGHAFAGLEEQETEESGQETGEPTEETGEEPEADSEEDSDIENPDEEITNTEDEIAAAVEEGDDEELEEELLSDADAGIEEEENAEEDEMEEGDEEDEQEDDTAKE